MDNKDKAQVRANILEVFMLQTDESMRDLFASAFRVLFEMIFATVELHSGDFEEFELQRSESVHNALLITRKIETLSVCSSNGYEENVCIFIQHTFPTVKKIFQTLINKTNRLPDDEVVCENLLSAMQLALQVRKRQYRM